MSNAILSWLRPKGPSTGATGTPVTFGSARNAAPVSILWSRFLPTPTPSQWQDILTADGLSNIFETLNSVPGVSIPRTPITLGARVLPALRRTARSGVRACCHRSSHYRRPAIAGRASDPSIALSERIGSHGPIVSAMGFPSSVGVAKAPAAWRCSPRCAMPRARLCGGRYVPARIVLVYK